MDWGTIFSAGDFILDVKQSHDLSQARRQLSEMQAATLGEALRKQYLESLRNFVFGGLKQTEVLEQHLENSPTAVYIAAKIVERNLQDVGISPVVFPDFADKEYVQQVQTKISRVIQSACSKLSSGQIAEAEDCFTSVTQMPLLDQAIAGASAMEQLQATDAEWKQLSGKQTIATMIGILVIVGSLFLFPVAGWIISALLGYILGQADQTLGALTCLTSGTLTIVGMGVGVVVGIVLLARRSSRQYKELDKARQELAAKIPRREIWGQIESTFGKQKSEGYQNLHVQRENQIMAVLGPVQGFDKLLS